MFGDIDVSNICTADYWRILSTDKEEYRVSLFNLTIQLYSRQLSIVTFLFNCKNKAHLIVVKRKVHSIRITQVREIILTENIDSICS